MSIALVVTGGFGNGTLVTTIKDVTLRGFSIGVAVDVWTEITAATSSWSEITPSSDSWTEITPSSDVWTEI